jgi:hypothetical protein
LGQDETRAIACRLKEALMATGTMTVVLAGDAIIDHHIYRGDREIPASVGRRGTLTRQTPGGATLLFDLLAKVSRRAATQKRLGGAASSKNDFNAVLGLKRDKLKNLSSGLQGYGVWQPFPTDRDCKEEVWRLADALGYGESGAHSTPPPYDSDVLARPADIVVLDDHGLGFRVSTANEAWPACLREADAPQPAWVVLKMGSPVAVGDLWRTVSSDRLADRTIVVVDIDDIRRGEVRVTSGISWERTALDLVYELSRNPALSPLLKCRHCVVLFGAEGALHVDTPGPGARSFRLIFDPEHMEGDWSESEGIKGGATGFRSCLTAAMTTRLALDGTDDSLSQGIIAGLAAMREMHRVGHGEVADGKPGVQFDDGADAILEPRIRCASVTVPAPPTDDSPEFRSWTIMAGGRGTSERSLEPLYGIARRVAILGPSALTDIPYQEFGKLFVVDRTEIESLRNLRQLIRDYRNLDAGKKPLSVAVFGAPGSGKSFSVKQVARTVLGRDVPILEFNLSQFPGTGELVGALHQVRDKVLEGTMPVVFWDEFDSREYMWLQYLLAPMQDGAFQEGQIVHPIGKCVFVFAGGTSYDFENFGPPARAKQEFDEFRLAKGPDFRSRLNGYLNVLGPNRRQVYDSQEDRWVDDESDICFPVRRALLLRAFLGCFGDKRLMIDGGVLSAFLELGRYKHGARSMEMVAHQMMTRGLPGQVRRSDLPPAEVMSMHADHDEFMSIANRDLKFKTLAAQLAPAVHKYYRQRYPTPETDKPFDQLDDNYKADNVAAAMRIPWVLGLGHLYVVPHEFESSDSTEDIERIIEEKLELFAEAEHDGWMEYKLLNGWTYGPATNEESRTHWLLVPYSALPEPEKRKDRHGVRNYQAILETVDYKIVRSLPREQ